MYQNSPFTLFLPSPQNTWFKKFIRNPLWQDPKKEMPRQMANMPLQNHLF